MKIVLTCNNAVTLRNQILRAAEDDTLKTWETRKPSNAEKVLIHTTSNHQWENDVLIVLTPHHNGSPFYPDTLEISDDYWEGKPEPSHEQKSYVYGRFTEVLLAHFYNNFSGFKIEK